MEQQTNLIQPLYNQNDHDIIIEVRTTLRILVDEVKKYNSDNTALELRVRTLETTKNETLGGWKTMLLFGGALSGLSSLTIGIFNILRH